jgi:hypothetical protein
MGHLPKQWTLKSLTIGPQLHETDTQFWEDAFMGLPPLPSVDNVTIIYCYPTTKAFNTHHWQYFDRLLTRRDLFPSLERVYIQPSIRSRQLSSPKRWAMYGAICTIKSRGLMPCKLLAFE